MTLPLRAAPLQAGEPARTPADDDDLPELPSIGGSVLGGTEEAATDLVLDDEIDDSEGEDVGLDAAVGMDDEDEGVDDLELDDGGLDAWDASDDALDEDAELGDEGDEGGWTDGSEAAEPAGWDTDLDDLDERDEPAPIRDQGEEGVDERLGGTGGDEDDAPLDLPLVARGEDELADDLELEDEAEIEAPSEDRIEHPALALRDAEPDTIAWRWLGPDDDAIVAIGGGLAAGRVLYRIDGPSAEPWGADDPLAGEVATTLAHVPGVAAGDGVGTENEAWIIGLRMGGALRSIDEAPFERLEALRRDPGALDVLAEPHAGGTRLWSRTHGGALSRSDDLGTTWSRPLIAGAVHALGRAGDGGVVAVIGGRHGGALRVMRTADGGRGWRSLGGPVIEAIPDAAELSVVADGRHLVIACDTPGVGPFVSRDEGQTWQVLEPIRDTVAIAGAREGGAVVLYAAVLCEGIDRGLVVRVPLETSDEPEIVLDLDDVRREHRVTGAGDSEGDQRVHSLVAEPGDEGTTLWIGSGLGVVRAVVKSR